MLKKVIKIQIVDNFVAWYYRFARARAWEIALSPSLSFQSHLWRLLLSDEMACSKRMVHSVHLRLNSHSNVILFSLAEDHLSSRQCLFVFVFVFFSMNRNYNDTTNELLSLILVLSSLTLSRSRSLVVTTLVLCSFCFFFLKISRSFLEKAFFPSSSRGLCNL